MGFTILNVLQCEYYNRGHPDTVDQLDDRKITIRSWFPRKLVVNHNYHITMDQSQPIATRWKSLCFLRSPLEYWRRQNCKRWSYFCLAVACLLYVGTMVAKKLLVSDKITACGETNVSWVLYVKFRIEEHSLVKLFAFLKNVCYQYFYFVPFFCFLLFCFMFFTSYWLAHNQLSWNVFFSCNGIDQLCLGGPDCSSHTIRRPRSAWMLDGITFGYNIQYFESTLIIYVLLCGYTLCRDQIQGGHGNNGYNNTHSSSASPKVPDCFPHGIVSFALI